MTAPRCEVCHGPLHKDPSIAAERAALGRRLCMARFCQRFVSPGVVVVGQHKGPPLVVSHREAAGHNYDTKGRS